MILQRGHVGVLTGRPLDVGDREFVHPLVPRLIQEQQQVGVPLLVGRFVQVIGAEHVNWLLAKNFVLDVVIVLLVANDLLLINGRPEQRLVLLDDELHHPLHLVAGERLDEVVDFEVVAPLAVEEEVLRVREAHDLLHDGLEVEVFEGRAILLQQGVVEDLRDFGGLHHFGAPDTVFGII